MRLQRPLIAKFFLMALWLSACYAVRYLLMEDSRWVELCYGPHGNILCDVRGAMGLVIHFRVLATAAVLIAVPAFLLGGDRGRTLAWIALLFALPALVLYTVTPAVFALLLALLRLVRAPRHNANVRSAAAAAQVNA